jgi:transcriptional regulator with XRE-family HTH domain
VSSETEPRVGQRIREVRLARRLTQRQLGRKLGVVYQQVQHYERGQKLSLDRLIAIAEVLNVRLSHLLAP